MNAEYSVDAVAAARSLQTYTYIYTSAATFWAYDYVCSLHQEFTFLFQSRWTKVKGLYIVTRYVPFLLFAGHLYLNFIPKENPDECLTLNNICSCLSLISIICSECFFILRTYALWNNNKFVLAVMVTAGLAVVVTSITVLFAATTTAPYVTSPIPGITGCYLSSASIELFVPFVLLLAFELGLISLTLIRAIQSWQTTNNRLFAVLLKHNIFYYACGLFFSAANVFMGLLLHYSYNVMFEDFQLIILAILATRMHLHLWHVDRHIHGSDALMLIPLSDVSSFLPRTQEETR
ncbi:hypothetical protein DEU56DRAFT_593546 [Suillus clintonianus]|uniref:uncharacterized protein n=1 Tax=Suillus clintonianus TaxID=1904413 RepID=UPI001B861723|nr:uncharacterized protein DEU56DRAFT_593546 [Suillus clintonianus]KAG2124610.1 hypothetical protein DEU56DRAFT_593546 [Suillus clintonianus]